MNDICGTPIKGTPESPLSPLPYGDTQLEDSIYEPGSSLMRHQTCQLFGLASTSKEL